MPGAGADRALSIDDADGTDILLNAMMVADLGKADVVRRALPLDPDQIKNDRLAAAAVAPTAFRQ